MAESTEKSVGKFAVAEEAPNSTGENSFSEAVRKEVNNRAQSPADSLDDTFTLKTSQPRRRGRPPGSKNKPIVQAVSEAPVNHTLWAQLLIGSTNTVVVTWLGPECAMERREAEMLEPPIARILARLPPGDAQKLSVFIDPMVILIALGTWGNRIVRIQRSKRAAISDAELARASGVVDNRSTNGTQPPPEPEATYQQPAEPDLPARSRVAVNPNGVPRTITDQIGEI